MDSKITYAIFSTIVAMAIGYLYAKMIHPEDDSAIKQAVRAGVLMAMSHGIVMYFMDGGKDVTLTEPFYAS